MTLLLTAHGPSLFDDLGGEPTLDDVLAGAWEGLTARAVVPCPVCGSEMQPLPGHPQPTETRSIDPQPVRGWCEDCGSRLT